MSTTKRISRKPVDDERAEEEVKLEPRGDFTIGQIYTKTSCSTYICRECGSDKFTIGHDDYFTAIKCPTCGYELCIHNG